MSDGYKIYIDADFIPAQAENANTLDGKTAEEFALTSDVESLQSQIGDQPVADQIINVVSKIDTSKWNYVQATCKNYADLDSVLQALDFSTAFNTADMLSRFESVISSISSCTPLSNGEFLLRLV